MIKGNVTVKVLRNTETGFDKYNRPTTTSSEIVLNNVLVAWGQTNTAESITREQLNINATIYLPSGFQVLETDKFMINNDVYEKEGEAIQWTPPFANFPPVPVIVNVRKSDG
jgi:hypothetical protein